MGSYSEGWLLLYMAMVLVVDHDITLASGAPIGVCYGLKGENLPSPTEVIKLYHAHGIKKIRIYEPDLKVLEALDLYSNGLIVTIGVKNEDLQQLAMDQKFANYWVLHYVLQHIIFVKIRYVTLGNEVIPGPDAQYVLPAMHNIQKSLDAGGVGNMVKATTVVHSGVLGTSYPPSQGAFSADVVDTMTPIVSFLASTGAPLMANIYPYFAYASDPSEISLDYALFTSPTPMVHDMGLDYQNLFDAMVDSFNSALEKMGGSGVNIVVSESGWPSAGDGDIATIANAQTYNSNLVKHVLSNGTPKRPNMPIDAHVFAMFNEDLKPNSTEENFGLFYPNMQPVYPINFN